MDDNDLLCVEKYLDTIRDLCRANPGQLRKVQITWKCLPDCSTFPELEVELFPVPDAVATETRS